MKLRVIVGILVACAVAVILYIFAMGFWIPKKPVSPMEKAQGTVRAAQGGLFDKSPPPIVH